MRGETALDRAPMQTYASADANARRRRGLGPEEYSVARVWLPTVTRVTTTTGEARR